MTDYNTILAGQVTLKIKRGDTVSATFTITDPNDNDNPYDLSVFTTIVMQIKWHRESNKNFAELTLANGDMVISGASNNVLTVDLFTDIKPGMYFFDIEGDGETTFMEGEYIIDQDVTRITP